MVAGGNKGAKVVIFYGQNKRNCLYFIIITRYCRKFLQVSADILRSGNQSPSVPCYNNKILCVGVTTLKKSYQQGKALRASAQGSARDVTIYYFLFANRVVYNTLLNGQYLLAVFYTSRVEGIGYKV